MLAVFLRTRLRFFGARLFYSLYGGRGFGLAFLEFLDASRCVYELLFAGVERVAVAADFNLNGGSAGADGVGFAASAAYFGFRKVFRVYVFFGHNVAYYTRLNYLCKTYSKMEALALQGVIGAPPARFCLPQAGQTEGRDTGRLRRRSGASRALRSESRNTLTIAVLRVK